MATFQNNTSGSSQTHAVTGFCKDSNGYLQKGLNCETPGSINDTNLSQVVKFDAGDEEWGDLVISHARRSRRTPSNRMSTVLVSRRRESKGTKGQSVTFKTELKKNVKLTLLDKRKLRENITEIYNIREAVSNLKPGLLKISQYQKQGVFDETRGRFAQDRSYGDFYSLYNLSSGTGGCEDTQL